MGPVRKNSNDHYTPYAPQYSEPAAADYSDEVTEQDLQALNAMVASELEGEEWELIDGPGW